MILAKDIMSDHVVVIHDDMRIRQIAHLLLRDRVSGFPVVDKAEGLPTVCLPPACRTGRDRQGQEGTGKDRKKPACLIGIITLTDLFAMIHRASAHHEMAEFYQRISDFQDLTVGEVMSRDVVSITPETTLSEIIHFVVEKGIHVFPVLEEDEIVGIVSRHDILNAVFSLKSS